MQLNHGWTLFVSLGRFITSLWWVSCISKSEQLSKPSASRTGPVFIVKGSQVRSGSSTNKAIHGWLEKSTEAPPNLQVKMVMKSGLTNPVCTLSTAAMNFHVLCRTKQLGLVTVTPANNTRNGKSGYEAFLDFRTQTHCLQILWHVFWVLTQKKGQVAQKGGEKKKGDNIWALDSFTTWCFQQSAWKHQVFRFRLRPWPWSWPADSPAPDVRKWWFWHPDILLKPPRNDWPHGHFTKKWW